MGWMTLKGMWKSKIVSSDATYYNLKRDRGDFKTDVKLRMKVSKEGGDAPESIDAFTDDDVFKELINIVVDVFSHKTKKRLLAFELPNETDNGGFLKKMCSDETLAMSGSRSDIVLPLRPARKSNGNKVHRLSIIRSEKFKRRKERLNPFVQTVLNAKRDYSNLEGLFRVRHRKLAVPLPEPINRQLVPNAVTSVTKNDLVHQRNGSNLHLELQDVSHALEDLAHMIMDEYFFDARNSVIYSREISNHLTDIKSNIGSIKSYLQRESSVNSTWDLSDLELKVRPESLNMSRKRRRFKLIRVGADTPANTLSSVSAHKRHHAKLKWRKKEDHPENIRDPGLEDVLQQFEKVKKEETRIVKTLLNHLGLSPLSSIEMPMPRSFRVSSLRRSSEEKKSEMQLARETRNKTKPRWSRVGYWKNDEHVIKGTRVKRAYDKTKRRGESKDNENRVLLKKRDKSISETSGRRIESKSPYHGLRKSGGGKEEVSGKLVKAQPEKKIYYKDNKKELFEEMKLRFQQNERKQLKIEREAQEQPFEPLTEKRPLMKDAEEASDFKSILKRFNEGQPPSNKSSQSREQGSRNVTPELEAKKEETKPPQQAIVCNYVMERRGTVLDSEVLPVPNKPPVRALRVKLEDRGSARQREVNTEANCSPEEGGNTAADVPNIEKLNNVKVKKNPKSNKCTIF